MRYFYYILIICLCLNSCQRETTQRKNDAIKNQTNTSFPFTVKDFPNTYPDLQPKTTAPLLQWIKKTDTLPNNIVAIQNINSSPIYICHAILMNQTLPGELKNNQCLITYGGKSYLISDYELLMRTELSENWRFPNNAPREQKCETKVISRPATQNPPVYIISKNLAVPFTGGTTPSIGNVRSTCHEEIKLPFVAGTEDQQPVYICKAIYQQTFRVGKLVGTQCGIATENGGEIFLPPYEILYE